MTVNLWSNVFLRAAERLKWENKYKDGALNSSKHCGSFIFYHHHKLKRKEKRSAYWAIYNFPNTSHTCEYWICNIWCKKVLRVSKATLSFIKELISYFFCFSLHLPKVQSLARIGLLTRREEYPPLNPLEYDW